MRTLGGTDITVAALTFGCGNVGGLMVRGDPREQREAVALALDAGIRTFDTAPLYGDGLSEETLGQVLPRGDDRIAVCTKVRLTADTVATAGGVAGAVRASLEASLRRLGRERVDLYQFHNPIDAAGAGDLSVERILGEVLPALRAAQRAGTVRHIGFTALGDAASVERLADAGGFAVAQVPYNLLDASAAQDAAGGETGRLLGARRSGLGTIGIRVLAGGALGGTAERHPLASTTVAPVGRGPGTAQDYAGDLAAAERFQTLVRAGAARSLPALAIRYALSLPALDTLAVGFSDLAHLREALAAAAAGPLDAAVLAEIGTIKAQAGAAFRASADRGSN